MVGALGGVVTRGVPGARGYDGLSVVGPKKLRHNSIFAFLKIK